MQRSDVPQDPDYLAGTPVFDAEGEKVGAVHGYDVQGGVLTVTRGWFFPKDTSVPLAVVARNDADGIYLTLSRAELERQSWAASEPTHEAPAANGSARGHIPVETVDGDLRVPVYAEELVVGVEVEEAGRLHVHKEVLTEQETVTVALRQERVSVQRVALDAIDQATLDEAFTERDIEVPLLGEEAVVGKRVAGVEEVVIHKDVATVREQVADTVRRERVVVDEDGRTRLQTAPAIGTEAPRRGKKRNRR